MTNKNFEVKQLFKAYRNGVISEEFLSHQLDELIGSKYELAKPSRRIGGGLLILSLPPFEQVHLVAGALDT